MIFQTCNMMEWERPGRALLRAGLAGADTGQRARALSSPRWAREAVQPGLELGKGALAVSAHF